MRIIAHLDMDAFFAAVEEREKPRIKGMPIVVGSDPADGRGRGVVSTANYKAREYGIFSATPISKAWGLSEIAKKQGKPPVVFIGGNFKLYEKISENIMGIIKKYSSVVEQAGIDEAYFDLSPELAEGLSFVNAYKKAAQICEKIKKEIAIKEKLSSSVGIGPNKLIAKIASDYKKPNGLTIIEEKDAEKFLEPMKIRKIPGIGPKTEIIFSEKNIKTVGDLKKFSQEELVDLLGKWGSELYEKVRGRDDSPLVTSWEAKSIGEQETFDTDTIDANFIFERLRVLCKSVFNSFKNSEFNSFRTIGVTVRFSDFKTKTRVSTLPAPAKDLTIFNFEAMRLIAPFLDRRENPQHKKIRLIGARVEKLEICNKLDL